MHFFGRIAFGHDSHREAFMKTRVFQVPSDLAATGTNHVCLVRDRESPLPSCSGAQFLNLKLLTLMDFGGTANMLFTHMTISVDYLVIESFRLKGIKSGPC
jgi:hypothetical protein